MTKLRCYILVIRIQTLNRLLSSVVFINERELRGCKQNTIFNQVKTTPMNQRNYLSSLFWNFSYIFGK